jgi:single-stranded-DNA-specific exonuclease
VYVSGSASLVGNNHLKMCVKQDDSATFDCIGFGLGDYIVHVNKGVPFEMCYTIEENVWKDRKTVQLNIKGIRTIV